ncbi:hypothetical protein BLNAU_17163 [Blattamonas nauphoetae]|uniref:Uncharacterized protein n=1 Tax=Blattamonas nauphoetae TaxID=2049346 RepID=A0ABQ9XCC6_9EUKA|nr:hypothetical protein BLNAU_17163 [Blattamonas nauphoetae]
MKTEIEFVEGKVTLSSSSPWLTLDLSSSYSITSIVGIVPSSSSSLSNDLIFPLTKWSFNLDSNPPFYSFTTPDTPVVPPPDPPVVPPPEDPPTLTLAKAHLVSKDEPLAFVALVLSADVTGSFDIVVEERGKDVTITVEFEEFSAMGESSDFVVVGDDRILTHDTTYTIKSILPTPGTDSVIVLMNDTITFHIPKSSYDPKKSKISPETKKLLSWLVPLVVSLLVALIVVIVLVILLRRRLVKSEAKHKEMEEQTDERLDEKMEVEAVAADNTNAMIPPQAISHSNFGPDDSLLPTEVGQQQSSKGARLASWLR